MPAKLTGDILEVTRFRQIFDLAVARHIEKQPFTVADITRLLGRTASSVHQQVERLEQDGLLVLRSGPSRGRYVTLSEEGLRRADLLPREASSLTSLNLPSGYESDVPIYSAPCGVARYASGEVEYLAPRHLFPSYRAGDRIVIAEGNSMVAPMRSPDYKKSIYDSDLVWARDDMPLTPGACVYAEYQTGDGTHECTIKSYEFDPQTGMVHLRPFNPDYPLIVRPERDVEIHAVVMGVRRLLGGDRK